MASTLEQKRRVFSEHMYTFLLLTFVFYPTLSRMQFEGFVCQEFDGGTRSLLQADYSIDCASPRYQTFFVLNVLMTTLTQSVPLFYLAVLYSARRELTPPSDRSENSRLRDR